MKSSNWRRGPQALGYMAATCLALLACVSGQTGDAGLGAEAVGTDTETDAEPPAEDDGDGNSPTSGGTGATGNTGDDADTETDDGGDSAPTVTTTGSGSSPAPTSTVINNPSGDCVPSSNGGRVGDHAPEQTDTYLPDCNGNLELEYYRVFRQANDTAYMIPRPDGHSAWVEPCADSDHPLHDIVSRYKLCEEPGSAEVTEAVNAMAAEDALALAHYLHEQLVFYAEAGNVVPWPFRADILHVCKTNDALRTGDLQQLCDSRLATENLPTDDIGVTFTPAEAAALAAGLNEAYGIDSELCDRLTASAREEMQRTLSAARSCTSDADCRTVGHASACHDSCSAVANMSPEIDATRERIDAAQCATFERAECVLIIPPCVPPSPELRCVDDLCSE